METGNLGNVSVTGRGNFQIPISGFRADRGFKNTNPKFNKTRDPRNQRLAVSGSEPEKKSGSGRNPAGNQKHFMKKYSAILFFCVFVV